VGNSVSDSGSQKKEGEPLHIASPSTIPLTLGEEMAVLVLPGLFYQIAESRERARSWKWQDILALPLIIESQRPL